MCGIVTLLGNPIEFEVESLRGMLEHDCGIIMDDVLEFVHFSYHVAEDYDQDLLLPILKKIALEIQPFKVQTTGLGLFSGENPALYIQLVKNSQLLQFHDYLWKRVSPAARGIVPYYAPQNWVPHITIVQETKNQKSISCAMERIVDQAFNWELDVDNVAFVGPGIGQSKIDIHQYQLVGNTSEIYPRLPLSAGSRSALVIVDMQGHFFKHPDRRKGLEEVIQNINRLIGFFDNNELPVVHAITSFNADGSDWDLKMTASNTGELIEGEYNTQILPNIHVSERHTIVRKTRYSAFFNTDLAELLNMEEIQRVVVVGAYTHYCVNATIFDAYAHDFVPCIITDAVISHLDSESDVMISRMRRNGYHTHKASEFLKGSA